MQNFVAKDSFFLSTVAQCDLIPKTALSQKLVFCTDGYTNTYRWLDRQADSSMPPENIHFAGA